MRIDPALISRARNVLVWIVLVWIGRVSLATTYLAGIVLVQTAATQNDGPDWIAQGPNGRQLSRASTLPV
jgi:hypothetical protein